MQSATEPSYAARLASTSAAQPNDDILLTASIYNIPDPCRHTSLHPCQNSPCHPPISIPWWNRFV